MLQWNSCRQRPDVLSIIQCLRKLVKADSVYILILLQNITAKRFPGFRFLCYCLLLFVTVISVARVCRGLDRFLFFYQSTAF